MAMKKKKYFLLPLLLLMLCILSVNETYAAGTGTAKAASQTKSKANSWGWHTTASGRKYYVRKGGKRAVGWLKLQGQYYYFESNGYLTQKTGWVQIKGSTYFIRQGGYRCAPGFCKILDNYYYFDKNGKLVTNKRTYAIGKKYYNIDSKGVIETLSSLKASCQLEAQKFIQKHSKESMTQREKLRSCFNYLLAYMRYRPQPPRWSDFKAEEWYYQKAVATFQTMNGNCYSFACCVAACAKELGYQPTVIVITADHGFVMIDGKYYDNMYGGLFGSSTPSHRGYTVYTKVDF